MRGRFSGGTTSGINNERGAVLVVMAVAAVLFSICFAGLAEFGRYLIAREELQTAADAAALAASRANVTRWVRVKVVTDRGEEEHCSTDADGSTTCTCDPCGERAVRVTGDETYLLDEGNWRDFCLPECSCGGGDCWFEIQKRWVTYEITDRYAAGADPQEIERAVKEVTDAAREALAWKSQDYGRTMNVLAGLDLYGMRNVLSSSGAWIGRWTRKNCDECYSGGEACSYSWGCYDYCPYECCECRSDGYDAYYRIAGKKEWLDRLIAQVERMRNANWTIPEMELLADDAADGLFYANLPQQTESAMIRILKVHGQQSDPYYPSVTVYGRGWVKSLFFEDISKFGGFFGLSGNIFRPFYTVDVCGQGDTFYRDASTQEGKHYGPLVGIGKWRKPPPDACWEDLQ